MCGRFMLFDEAQDEELRRIIDELGRQFRGGGRQLPTLKSEEILTKSGEIFPTDTVPILTAGNGEVSVVSARWGFPKFKGAGVIINARAETLEEKPTFRKSFREHRCIVPANGYLEWKRTGAQKEKYLIRTEKPVLFMAGLYDVFRDKNNTPYTGFVIITTEPNSVISRIHNRMPAILPPEKIGIWLGDDGGESKRLLVPFNGRVVPEAV